MIVDANGNLFGTTRGLFFGDGTVFEIENTGTVAAPVYARTATTLVSFNGSNGQDPQAGLTADANGNLFGTTYGGGAYGDGTVFEIQNLGTIAAPVYASAPTTLVNFDGSNGARPAAQLTPNLNALFGTTLSGGANGTGTAFEISGVFVLAPTTIVGTGSLQTTPQEVPVRPFAHVTISDKNPGATDTLTITLGGVAGPWGGTLYGTGLSGGAGGVYTLALEKRRRSQANSTPWSSAQMWASYTKFTLSDQTSAGGAPTVRFDHVCTRRNKF